MEEDYPGGWNVIRRTFLQRGFLETGLHAIKSSISSTTMRQYNCYLKKWWNFCIAMHINPYTYSFNNIIKILNSEFERGVSYSTLNWHQSALVLIFSINVEHRNFLKRFLKGIFNQRPSRPKYELTWDPSPVLQFLAILHPLEDLPPLDLTKKLVGLLALCTGQRVQTFSKIQLSNIRFFPDKVEIHIHDKIKTTRPGVVFRQY